MGSIKFRLNKTDVLPILKVLGWSVASVVVACLISLVGKIEISPELSILIPIANTILYAIKKFIEDNSQV